MNASWATSSAETPGGQWAATQERMGFSKWRTIFPESVGIAASGTLDESVEFGVCHGRMVPVVRFKMMAETPRRLPCSRTFPGKVSRCFFSFDEGGRERLIAMGTDEPDSMKPILSLRSATALSLLFPILSHAGEMAEVISLKEPVNLLEKPREAFRFHLNPETAEDAAEGAEDVFKLDSEKGHLLVSGRTWGYIRTAERYRDYHVSLEYRFLGPTSGTRKEKARDSGLLLHCFGEDGSFKTNWMPSIEAQIMEGTTGDFIVLGPFDDAGVVTPVHLESTGTKMNGQPIPSFDPDGSPWTMPKEEKLTNALASRFRHADWKQTTGVRFETDADYETGKNGTSSRSPAMAIRSRRW